jgi:hypothetical protein
VKVQVVNIVATSCDEDMDMVSILIIPICTNLQLEYNKICLILELASSKKEKLYHAMRRRRLKSNCTITWFCLARNVHNGQ